MHRCLQIPEIMLHIVSELDSPRVQAQLAQTCHLFCGPALDALWYQPGQDTILYLLRCLPEDLLVEKMVSGEVVLELKRPAVLCDWERFQSYSNRVRAYSHFFGYPKVLDRLALWMPGDLLLPHLHRLHWHGFGIEGEGFIRLFLAPNLRSILFSGRRTPSLLSQLPAIIQRRLPLRSFTLSSYGATLTSFELRALSLFVQTLSRITLLFLPSLDSEALEFLRAHPCLTTLDIESFPSDPSFGVPRLPSPSFQNLRSFTSLQADIPTMLRLLPLLSGPLLEQLTVRPTPSATTKQITAFYSAVSTHCQPSCLLSFHNDCFDYSDGEFHQIELNAFRGLCRFTKLTSILILTRGGFQFGDDGVEELARACPALTELRLRQFSEDSTFTLSILVSLAAHCKNLSGLEMTVNTAVVPSIYPTPDTGERLSHHALREFCAGYSALEDAFPVAHFLSSVFPSGLAKLPLQPHSYRAPTAHLPHTYRASAAQGRHILPHIAAWEDSAEPHDYRTTTAHLPHDYRVDNAQLESNYRAHAAVQPPTPARYRATAARLPRNYRIQSSASSLRSLTVRTLLGYSPQEYMHLKAVYTPGRLPHNCRTGAAPLPHSAAAAPAAAVYPGPFPSLNIVYARRDANEEHDENEADAIIEKRWEEVYVLIPRLGAIRKEEQAWATHAVAKS
ncbi:hypothetical protein C8F01DRAFT_1353803 [Mycena amicta]|nr:hypothetical protein C8F01DRAFT_1353803 [Mycena amicta]